MNVAERRNARARGTDGARTVPAHYFALKRALDLLIGGTAAIVSLPIVALAAAGIAAVSPGSPFFFQERVGQDGRRFRMIKLRTMIVDAERYAKDIEHLNEVSGPVFKIKSDPRLHALGALLRRTSIDELPNFYNVLRGEMAIVGPRPPLPSEVANYAPEAHVRLTAKPGITCLWQISGRSNVPFDAWVELDRQYIETWSPLGDLVIIARTIPAVLRGVGAH
jgi:lipopolysaccharide/colanic/teichoic acid biosynthesis glycosyltransferase